MSMKFKKLINRKVKMKAFSFLWYCSLELWISMKSYSVTIQKKATEQYFLVSTVYYAVPGGSNI